MDLTERVAYTLCSKLRVPVTQGFLSRKLQDHPDYPSLLSVSDVLSAIKVDNLTVKVERQKVYEIPVPFIAQILVRGEEYLTVVTSLDENNSSYYDPTNWKTSRTDTASFLRIFTGIAMMVRPETGSGDIDYRKAVFEEKFAGFSRLALILALPVLLLCLCIKMLAESGTTALPNVAYAFFTLAGGCITGVLILREIDLHNPAWEKICSLGKKSDCSSVLDSPSSSVLGFKWSIIGLGWFTGLLICLCLFNLGIPSFLAWMNFAGIGVTIYSITWQYLSRKWCTLCLLIQSVILLQCLSLSFRHFQMSDRTTGFSGILVISIIFLLPFLLLNQIIPFIKSAKDEKGMRRELQRLKNNAEIFAALLEKQKRVEIPSDNMGIIIGNAEAKCRIVKVCNPYCGPCAKTHVLLEKLIKDNPDIQIQIIFTATADDYRTPPVKHLLAIYEEKDEVKTLKALDDWYNSPDKNYDNFASRYPAGENLDLQTDKIGAMNAWCKQINISFTPTIFISAPQQAGIPPNTCFQIPPQYSVQDLNYFLSN